MPHFYDSINTIYQCINTVYQFMKPFLDIECLFLRRLIMKIFSTVILSLPLIQEGQLSVSGERMCTILVNPLED